MKLNLWAEEATRGLVKEILPAGSVDNSAALILATAFYFRGSWDQSIGASKTQIRDFILLYGEIIRVPFMTGERYEEYRCRSFDGYKVIKLPYQSDQDFRQFSMYFFLRDKKDGLLDLVAMFNSKPSSYFSQQFDLWLEELRDFWILKFKFSSEFEASKTIQDKGLREPFMDGKLTEMVNSPNSDIYQKYHRSHTLKLTRKGQKLLQALPVYPGFLVAGIQLRVL